MLDGFLGMRLNTAGVLIGWIGAVLSFLYIILFSVSLDRLDELVKYLIDNKQEPKISEENLYQAVFVLSVLYITINVINLVASALLIVGAVKERHLLLVPWLLNSGLSIFCNVLYLIYILALLTTVPFSSLLIALIIYGISITAHLFIWYAVYSLFKKLQASREQQQLLGNNNRTAYPSYTKI